MAWHPLFTKIAKGINESRRRQLVAQIFMLFWTVRNEGKFCDIKSASIDQFYHSQVGFDEESTDAKQFRRICGMLESALHGRPRIVGHYLIHLFLLVDSLLDEYALGWESYLAEKLNEFDERRQKAASDMKARRESDHELYYSEYGRLTQTQSDISNTIRRRHAFFVEKMLELLDPKKLDPNRSFSDLERRTVFFRDGEICQWSLMEKKSRRVLWEESEIHHVVPHSKGGLTKISNAALVHRDCHPKSEKDVDKFNEWWRSRTIGSTKAFTLDDF